VKVQGAGGCTVKVEVFSATADYVAVLSSCFDLPRLKAFVGRADVRIAFDALHGATGPYAREILVDLLGAREDSLLNCTPREDFGGKASRSHGHADPNLVNARELCELMGVDPRGAAMPQVAGAPAFGAAADGDADRNMILGPGFFVTPSDSLAVLVDHAADAIPFFAGGVKGAARSMPTSGALDRVCKARDIPCFETPTGWKFFGNLMDEARFTPFVCGEESFGTGSNHVREKDGLWAVLAWLSVLAHRNPRGDAPLVGIPQIVEGHWRKYGRNYYARYDYEGVETERANAVMAGMTARLSEGQATWVRGQDLDGRVPERADVFEYKDPIDGSVSKNQGIRFLFADGSRIIFRLSGTGVSGATSRLYLEQYEPPQGDIARNALDVVKPLANLALALSDLPELTGRDSPSVIT
jgi:phosphoglucomutase